MQNHWVLKTNDGRGRYGNSRGEDGNSRSTGSSLLTRSWPWNARKLILQDRWDKQWFLVAAIEVVLWQVEKLLMTRACKNNFIIDDAFSILKWKYFIYISTLQNHNNFIDIDKPINANSIDKNAGESRWMIFSSGIIKTNIEKWLRKRKDMYISLYSLIAALNWCDFLHSEKNNRSSSTLFTAGYKKYSIKELFSMNDCCKLSTPGRI